MINESLPLKTENNSKKYQRSTTLVSQLSMGTTFFFIFQNFITFSSLSVHLYHVFVTESGIIADISSSPDNEVQTSEETSTWSKSSTAFLQPHKMTTNTNNMSQKFKTLNANVTHKLQTIDSDDMNATATSNPYINNDSIAVHL